MCSTSAATLSGSNLAVISWTLISFFVMRSTDIVAMSRAFGHQRWLRGARAPWLRCGGWLGSGGGAAFRVSEFRFSVLLWLRAGVRFPLAAFAVLEFSNSHGGAGAWALRRVCCLF